MASATGLFRREYEAELDAWLQRRFGYLCVAFAAVELIHAGWAIFWIILAQGRPEIDARAHWCGLASGLLGLAVVSAFLLHEIKRLESRRELLRATTWLILLVGGLVLLEAQVVRIWTGADSVWVLFRILLWHFLACCILPWHPRESLRPMVPLLIVWIITLAVGSAGGQLVRTTVAILLSPMALMPGLAIASIRLHFHGQRFATQMLGSQFRRLRRDLLQARTLHESIFPQRLDDGHVRFEYDYVPARDVGGDFINVHVGPTGVVSVVLVDVTGHGIAAALTVNRLYGEIERIRAEHREIEPAALLFLLNRYVSLTLSRHGIFATAVAFDIDPWSGELRSASAGHPPLLLRRKAGSVETIDPRGLILGAVGDDQYFCPGDTVAIAEGDTVIAYSDGLIEATNRRGEQLGVPRVAEILRRSSTPGNWPQFIASLVGRFRAGVADDDVLIASVSLVALRRPSATPHRSAAGSAAGLRAAPPVGAGAGARPVEHADEAGPA
ncbi:MAG TPA: PP2C family protein-serine/threonine phosphatase [Phycisphaerales bacterium]|nr:PP2C family protein-serine/threonine phosphatase [Phycisphaerales bacterium]HMP38425.1 PP2C family protein-serine/threonine phosphatase [Phycisphaerales bacterium]